MSKGFDDLFDFVKRGKAAQDAADKIVGEAYARGSDPGTSHAAAKSVAIEATRLEGMVCNVVRLSGSRGMICDEIVTATGLNWNTISPRIAPLLRKGMIRTVLDEKRRPITRKGKSGRQQRVYFFK